MTSKKETQPQAGGLAADHAQPQADALRARILADLEDWQKERELMLQRLGACNGAIAALENLLKPKRDPEAQDPTD